MKKKLNESQLIELGNKREWCIAITEFIYTISEENIMQEMKKMQLDIISGLFEKNNIKGMQTIFNDLNESTKGLSSKDYVKLNNVLQEKFGRNLDSYDKNNLITIKKIIKKGKITNNDEYRIVEAQVNELSQVNPSSYEIEILNNLLISFHISLK